MKIDAMKFFLVAARTIGLFIFGWNIGLALRTGDVFYFIVALPWLGGAICFYLANEKRDELNAKSNGFKPNTYLMRSFDKRKTVAKRRSK